MPGSLPTTETLLTIFYPLCSFRSTHVPPRMMISTFNHHTTVCVHYPQILDTFYQFRYKPIPTYYSVTLPYVCAYVSAWCVCLVCVCAQMHTWRSKADGRNHPQLLLHFIQGLSKKKKKNPELSQYGSSCRPACSGDLVSLRTISHTRPLGFWGFWGCLPSKH
jgi:hypothetical protein